MAVDLFHMIGHITMHGMNKFSRDMKAAEIATNTFAGKMTAMGQTVGHVGAGLTRNLSVPLALAGAAIIKTGADFDRAVTKSLAPLGDSVTPKLRREFEDLAIQLSQETTFSAAEVADAFYYLVTAGVSAEKAMATLGVVTEFAQAGNLNLALATENLTDVVGALGLDVHDTTQYMKNMAHVSDVITKASTIADATIGEFTEALMEAGGTMNALGVDIEEGTAALSGFAKNGLKGQRAGYALMMVIRDLSNAAARNGEAFDEAGIQVYDANGKFNDLTTIIDQLSDHFKGLSHEQRMNAIDTLGLNKRLSQYLFKLITVNDEIQVYREKLEDVSGFTKEVAEANIQDFYSQLSILWSHIQAVALILWRSLGPALKDYVIPAVHLLVAGLKICADAFDRLHPVIKNTVWALTAFATVLGPLLMLIGAAMKAIGFMSLALTGMKNALLLVKSYILTSVIPALKTMFAILLAHPIIAVVAAIGILIGWFIKMRMETGSTGAAFASMAKTILGGIKSILDSLYRLAAIPGIGELMGLTGLESTIFDAIGQIDNWIESLDKYINKSSNIKSETDRNNKELANSYIDVTRKIEEAEDRLNAAHEQNQEDMADSTENSQQDQTNSARTESQNRRDIIWQEHWFRIDALRLATQALQNEENRRLGVLMENGRIRINALRMLDSEELANSIQMSEEKLQARKQREDEWTEKVRQSGQSRIDELKRQMEEELANEENTAKARHMIRQFYEQKIREETRKTAWEMIQVGISSLNTLMSEWSRYTSARIQQIQTASQREITAIQNSKMSETQKQQHIQRIQAGTDAKVRNLQRQQARREKAMAIFNAIINGATAIVKVHSQLGAFGFVMAGIIGAMTAAQVALIAARPVPFAEGGMVKGRKGGVLAQVGEGAQDEIVFPLQTGIKALVDALTKEVSTNPISTRTIPAQVGTNNVTGGINGRTIQEGARKESSPAVVEKAGGGPTHNWHIGVLVADERGIKELERRQAKYRVSENQRKGLA